MYEFIIIINDFIKIVWCCLLLLLYHYYYYFFLPLLVVTAAAAAAVVVGGGVDVFMAFSFFFIYLFLGPADNRDHFKLQFILCVFGN